MEALPPTDTRELFHPLHRELLSLLRSLPDDDWIRPTVAGAWRVRDVVAHLIDTDLRRLSSLRDGYFERLPFDDLVTLLNNLNATWVAAARRLSPRILIEILDAFGPQTADALIALDPNATAGVSVLWAGETESKNWFDVGREYTERWHHQQQIRDAVGAPLLLSAQWLVPLIELSLRVLPVAYGGATASPVVIHVRDTGTWSFAGGVIHRGAAPSPGVQITFDPDTVWRVLYNALPPDVARSRVVIEGDAALAEPVFRARSVMV